ncbi:MAG: hypothetical protein LC749_01115 [Actinobacteria bacterium]|nr:hypothetical protein [Actinomycetota bacterium]
MTARRMTVADPATLPGRLVARLASEPLLRNSAYIMATNVVTSLLGYVFWLLVARTSDAETIGGGAATTSALLGAALFGSVGAAAAMIEWLPKSRTALEWRRRVTAGVVVAVSTSTAGALVVTALLGYMFNILPTLRTPGGGLLFCLGSMFFAVGTLVDYVALSERRGEVMLLRNLVSTCLRIPLLFLPTLVPGTTDQVLASWTLSAGLSLLVSIAAFKGDGGRSLRPELGRLTVDLRQMAGSLVGQHLITIAAVLATYLLPVLVVARLSTSANAYFYATWMLGSVFFMISPAVSTSLFAEGTTSPGAMQSLVRKSVMIISALLVVPMLVYLLGGRLLLGTFGPAYPAAGGLLLVLLTLSAIPDAVTNIAVGVMRATNRLRSAMWLNTAMLVACLVGSWFLLPHLGIVAVGISWIGSQSLGALWVLVWWSRAVCSQAATITPAPTLGAAV